MRTVGVRELKNRLSHYLRLVRSGERVLITNRGKVVAEVALQEGEAQRLLGLERGGR
jgi:antitoxin (DNA-binding transcriptional repressor) of toxin-antitoxin stability system